MPRNIFEILNIKPTNDLRKLQKAFEKAKKPLEQRLKTRLQITEAHANLMELTEAWLNVNSQEKLDHFIQTKEYKNPIIFNDEASTEIVTLFIPVPTRAAEDRNTREVCLRLKSMVDKIGFQEDLRVFSLTSLALNRDIADDHAIVCSSKEELENFMEIAPKKNFLIAQVSVPKKFISLEKHDIGLGHSAYFLKAASRFKTEDIISVVPTQALSQDLNYKWVWPSINSRFVTVYNPNAKDKTQIKAVDPKDILPSLDLYENAQVKQLQTSIAAMVTYAAECTDSEKSKTIDALAKKLDEQLQLFILSLRNMTLTKELLANVLKDFKASFSQKLHQQDKLLSSERWSVIVANVFIALTGIGLLALLPQMAYSYYKTGHVEAFFSTTKGVNKVSAVETELEQCSAVILAV